MPYIVKSSLDIGGKIIPWNEREAETLIKEKEQFFKEKEEKAEKIEKVEEFNLPDTDIKRTIIIIRKIKNTPSKYPRKPGTPSKEPIK